MSRGRTFTFVLIALGVIALGTIAAASPDSGPLGIGMSLGTFFGLLALAAAWTAYGFSSSIPRIGQALLICGAAVLAMLLNGLLRRIPPSEYLEFAGAMSVAAVGQWLLIVVLLWPLMALRRIRLSYVHDLSADQLATSEQFGIRDLLVATLLAGIVLGAFRWILSQTMPTTPQSSLTRALFTFGFVALCNAIALMPLLVAPLVRRFAVAATLLALAFAAIVTAGEVSAWIQWIGPTPDVYIQRFRLGFWAINIGQALWVLVVLLIVRAGGYRLAPAKCGARAETSKPLAPVPERNLAR